MNPGIPRPMTASRTGLAALTVAAAAVLDAAPEDSANPPFHEDSTILMVLPDSP